MGDSRALGNMQPSKSFQAFVKSEVERIKRDPLGAPCMDCGVFVECGYVPEDGRAVCDECWQAFGAEMRDWLAGVEE